MKTEVAGKRVAVLGGGVEGVVSVRWLLGQGATVTVHDAADVADLTAHAELAAAGAGFVTGPDYLEALDGYEVLVRTPGLPFQHPRIQAALSAGTVVTSQTKLFLERCPAPVIGITGTKGKGTTATLLRDMLQAAGRTVFLGGNIGTPPFEFLADLTPDATVILELSSFQLQDVTTSPHLAIITNLGEDHLDHHADTDEYHAAKRKLLEFQAPDDIAVINHDDPASASLDAVGPAKRYYFGRSRRLPGAYYEEADGSVMVDVDGSGGEAVIMSAEIPIPGPHNLQNVLAATVAARVLGATPAQIKRAVLGFKPLPYHLEPLGTVGGVTYINDSYSTSPTSTIPAIGSFDGPVVLVAGGSDKGLDYDELARLIVARTKAVILIPPAGDRLRSAIEQLDHANTELLTTQAPDEVFPAIARVAAPGDTVLLSPAAASFGWFDNYRERGAWFSSQVAKLEQAGSGN